MFYVTVYALTVNLDYVLFLEYIFFLNEKHELQKYLPSSLLIDMLSNMSWSAHSSLDGIK